MMVSSSSSSPSKQTPSASLFEAGDDGVESDSETWNASVKRGETGDCSTAATNGSSESVALTEASDLTGETKGESTAGLGA